MPVSSASRGKVSGSYVWICGRPLAGVPAQIESFSGDGHSKAEVKGQRPRGSRSPLFPAQCRALPRFPKSLTYSDIPDRKLQSLQRLFKARVCPFPEGRVGAADPRALCIDWKVPPDGSISEGSQSAGSAFGGCRVCVWWRMIRSPKQQCSGFNKIRAKSRSLLTSGHFGCWDGQTCSEIQILWDLVGLK